MKKVVIDCDPGIDDAFALLYAIANPEFEVLLVTTVSGNVDVKKTTRNAKGLIEKTSIDIPVVMGADRPLVNNPVYATGAHGDTGLGSYDFGNIDLSFHKYDDVIVSLYDTIMQSSEKIYLIAIGPLTNIARLFLLYPEVKTNIECISLMGGGLKGGNMNMAAEFNVFVDPEAAKIVFDSGVPIIMAGLDVTEKALIYQDDLEKIRNIPKVGIVLHEILESQNNHYEDGSILHLNDVLSIMVLSRPDIFELQEYYVDVELEGRISRGLTLADQRLYKREEPNVSVITSFKYLEFKKNLFKELNRYG